MSYICIMDVRFYETKAGQQPARDYFRSLDEKQRLFVGAKIRAIQDNPRITDLRAAGFDVAPIGGKLMELRVGYHRIFYAVIAERGVPVMWLLHAAQKDTQKTPENDKKVSYGRLADLLARR
jgi:phage-related protein